MSKDKLIHPKRSAAQLDEQSKNKNGTKYQDLEKIHRKDLKLAREF